MPCVLHLQGFSLIFSDFGSVHSLTVFACLLFIEVGRVCLSIKRNLKHGYKVLNNVAQIVLRSPRGHCLQFAPRWQRNG
jgi:hypothetical protein